MDNTKEFTCLELCAGYAGISEGLKRAIPNLRVIAYVEREGFACANLVAKMEQGWLDSAPIWTDIKTFPSKEFYAKVDILVGGYPCQPFSTAGHRKGKDDPRHLWPYIAEIVKTVRPEYCFFENVEGHVTLGLSTVVSDLAGMGYKTTWGLFTAAEVGAPHQRKRVFILGYSAGVRCEQLCKVTRSDDTQQKERRVQEFERGSFAKLAHTNSNGRQRNHGTSITRKNDTNRWTECSQTIGIMRTDIKIRRLSQNKTRIINHWPARPNEKQYEWEPPRTVENTTSIRQRGRNNNIAEYTGRQTTKNQTKRSRQSRDQYDQQTETEREMGRDANGYPNRMVQSVSRTDELRLLGNGVVPQTVTKAFITLIGDVA